MALAPADRLKSSAGRAFEVNLRDPVLRLTRKRVQGYDVLLEADDDLASAIEGIRGLIARGFLRSLIDTTLQMDAFDEAYERLVSRKAQGAVLLRL